ncbi:MAG: glutathione S-transferase C-terminal domain-containing protein [Pseudomonadota bacterium]|nr:glutathione S-transferase C-terminal domain-containing protein [Pseudomonadota bacterium]
MTQPLTIIGNEGSPYSRKMRAVLRYRRIPHVWIAQMGPGYVPPPPVPVKVIPVLVWHDEDGAMREAMVDSTPQIQRLEREYAGRSLIPPDPALAFLSALVEDYADEWGTKLMFHYRWTDEAGIAWARRHLMLQIDHSVRDDKLDQFAQWFGDRQIGRRGLVGSSEQTRGILEDGYQRLLQALNGLLAQRRFLFGDRPAAGDFGLFGQLTQLCGFDPTSSRIAEQQAPRVVAWSERIEDLSGWVVEDAQWLARDAVLAGLRPLLTEIGASYVPFLLANAAAKAAGSNQVECRIRGERWQQPVFAYQAKCLAWLREHFAGLGEADQRWVRSALEGTGCEALTA